ncbi:hypothetical protein BJX66DRAFT_330989 [Aspergillus keveii]|uniref:F-box domain-containing protein n=1 Tax=Aspergillus keveii TaxID=714993 RepID=A0ABR4FHX2_9EURO
MLESVPQDILRDVLARLDRNLLYHYVFHTPNLRHLCVLAGHFTKFLNHILKEEDYLIKLESLESYDGPRLKLKRLLSLSIHRYAGLVHPGNKLEDTLPELQGKGDLLLRRSCEKLEEFTYLSPSGWDDEDTSPMVIIRALLSHKESLRSRGEPLEPDLFYNIRIASYLSFKLLLE